MAEVQTTDQSGETAQRFIEFVMMQAQQAAFYLGQIPNPQTGETEVHLEPAKIFIDQLAMIRVKTRGNLNNDETGVLNNAISNLQLAFFEASQAKGVPVAKTQEDTTEAELTEPAAVEPEISKPAVESPADGAESKKKFTKSYGA